MEMQTKTSSNAKDFFINLGAVVSLYVLVVNLIILLFTIINTIYPQVINGYDYQSSQSISWPVATLVILFPVFILLMWLMEKMYKSEPERKNRGIHRWLTYITLFISGLVVVGDLITVLYYFLDGQDLTAGFLLKVLVTFIVTGGVFAYYIYDVLDKLIPTSRILWRSATVVIVLGSIVWGFATLGSPATQRLYKYDQQKVWDLQNLNNQITNYYVENGALPLSLENIASKYYDFEVLDPQTDRAYEYEKVNNTTYEICANFNKDSREKNNTRNSRVYGDAKWTHPAGKHCFEEKINPDIEYSKPLPPIR